MPLPLASNDRMPKLQRIQIPDYQLDEKIVKAFLEEKFPGISYDIKVRYKCLPCEISLLTPN